MKASRARGIGSHHGLFPNWSDDWQTPPAIMEHLGPFDLDPCASTHQKYKTAKMMWTKESVGSGMLHPWVGRVWLNPPYGKAVGKWVERLAAHGDGIALVFARTDTEWFQRVVFGIADGVLFLSGRLSFIRPDGSIATHNSGGPSCLVAYGGNNWLMLIASRLPGKCVRL